MKWTRWIVIALMALEGTWMAVDGTRSLLVGDYVTAVTGPYAGQLGPWSKLVQAVGLDPRSNLMKSLYTAYGFLALGAAIAFALQIEPARRSVGAVAVLGLWYLPIGTAVSILVLVLLWLTR